MNQMVKSRGYCTKCLAPWAFGDHHTSGSSVDCAIQSRLQRVVLEKKPAGQSLGKFVGDIVSTPANYNEFLCTVVAPMIVARKTKGMMK